MPQGKQAAAWTPYSGELGPQSVGRMTLAVFLEMFLEAWDAIHIDELHADIMAPAPSPEVASTAEFLGQLIQDGVIRTFVRPIGGGDVQALAPARWELDSFLPRFRASGLNLGEWANPDAALTHYIFADTEDVEKFLESWCARPPEEDLPVRSTNLLKLPDVVARTGLSRSTVYEQIRRGEFPTPRKLGPRSVAWVEAEIEDWVAKRPSRA